jgi:alkanesulfonate monooxygenase SsuD/methylene tetrahydromethanopterin reductase-like flavin-dependent oxidoreductase (luciferase family)
MKFGFVFPGGDARTAADFALAAETAGWDGFFVWEPVWGNDAWVSLTAAAMLTERIRLGTLLTPLSRMRPWKLASESVTLDHLSGGRVIISVGLGALETGFAEFGEATSRQQRAELLDEGLEILTGLWRGQPFRFQGKHYQIEPAAFQNPPPPVQQPRIPIWVVGLHGAPRSIQRAVRYDGWLVAFKDEKGDWKTTTPDDLRRAVPEVLQQVRETRGEAEAGRYDIIVEGVSPGGDAQAAAAHVRPYAEAGATWWIESIWEAPSLDPVYERLRQGPPRH